MCKISSIVLQSTGCLLLLTNQPAHKWTIWTYRFCSMARDGRLCNNRKDLNALGEDYGSRAGACRVCDNEYRATLKYEAAVANAQSRYDVVVNDAWSKKLKEDEAAKYVIDTVSQILT
ncbi:hypothetical protein OCU04_001459 [Sclerotinia nivalis]|uniref:Uncharacterized protein n=1 Tax=Sclerotinia nivalis TaxID=352851 RepID=A0A9X0DRX9_9HELO|nr:hypothetical protein OCU04_001459 [Sclerotinia nivalis]